MPIDSRSEEIFSLTAATKLPCFRNRRGGKRSMSRLSGDWATIGVRGVKLETIMAGGNVGSILRQIGVVGFWTIGSRKMVNTVVGFWTIPPVGKWAIGGRILGRGGRNLDIAMIFKY